MQGFIYTVGLATLDASTSNNFVFVEEVFVQRIKGLIYYN